MARFADELPRPGALNAGLAAAAVLVCVAMRQLALAHPLLTATGLPVLAYNLLSLLLAGLFAASCAALGGLVVPGKGLASRLDRFLLRALTGFSLFTILGFALGMLRLLYPAVATAALALPLLFLPARRAAALPPSPGSKAALALLGLLMFWLCAVSGVLHVYIVDDFSHYYPMYRNFMASHSLYPDSLFWAYYYLKGSGAAHLLNAATSEYAVLQATTFGLGMIGLLTFRLVAMVKRSLAVPFAAGLLLIASKTMAVEAYKAHTVISMLVLAVPFFTTRLLLGPRSSRGRLRLALGLLLCAMVVTIPPSTVFLPLPLLLLLALGASRSKALSLRQAVGLCAVPALTFALLLGLNFVTTGLMEATPFALFRKFMDLDAFDRWLPVSLLPFLVAADQPRFITGTGKLSKVLTNYAIVAAACGLIYYALRARTPHFLRRMQVVLGPLMALGFLCPILLLTVQQASLGRLMIFTAALKVIIGTVGGLALVMIARVHLTPRLGRDVARPLSTLMAGGLACGALFFSMAPPLAHQQTAARAFFGLAPMGALAGRLYLGPQAVAQADALLPKGELVMPLQLHRYALWYDSRRFIRVPENVNLRDLPAMLSADPDTSEAALKRAGIRRFMVNLTLEDIPELMLDYAGRHSGLFRPGAVESRFRVRALPENYWLLTLRGTDADGAPPSAEFLELLARRQAMDATKPSPYPALMAKAAADIPGLTEAMARLSPLALPPR